MQQAKLERFYGIWFKNKRIGYVAEKLEPVSKGILLEQEAYLILNILETSQPINMHVTARLSKNLILQDFNFSFTSAFYKMNAQGHTTGNTVNFELDTGQSVIKDSVTLSGPPLLAVNDRNYLLQKLKKSGQKIKIPSFDPVSLTGRESIITYFGQDKILINKRLKALHRFTEETGSFRINFWLDDDGRIVKEESPAGFQFIAEPEFRAKDIVGPGSEILSAVAVKPIGPKPSGDYNSIKYKITIPSGIELDIHGGRQELNGNILSINREKFPSSTSLTGTNKCNDPQTLKPSRYVQSDNEQIINLGRSIVGNESDPALQVRMLSTWLYENIEKRPVLGLPDALTTLHTLKGDCNEHASLFAALARSLKINTAIVSGVTLLNNAFYYHAWNEVCLNGKWYSVDTTTNQLPADLFHIRFGKGDLEEQLKIGGLLGKLQIEFLPQE